MNPKPFFTSWTMWFGMTQIALAVVGYLSGLMPVDQCYTLLHYFIMMSMVAEKAPVDSAFSVRTTLKHPAL